MSKLGEKLGGGWARWSQWFIDGCERLWQRRQDACAWMKNTILHPWQWLSPLIVSLSLVLVVYCAFLFGAHGTEIYNALNVEQTLKDDATYFARTVSFCALWGIGVGWLTSRVSWLRRISGVMHMLQYLPVAACALVLQAGGFLWKTQTLSVICLAVLLILCVPSWLPVIKREKPKEEHDTLGRRLLYDKLSNDIRDGLANMKGQGLTVAITGTWGSGKSHLIRYVLRHLSAERTENRSDFVTDNAFGVAQVDVWQCSSTEAMWDVISESLASAILQRDVRLYASWEKILLRILKALNIPHVGLAEDILRIVTTGINGDSSATEKLNHLIGSQKKAYVLVLDNLDRCGGAKLRALLPLIEQLKNISNLVTICGIAYGEMSKIDKKIADVLDGTFLKIFDCVIPMPHVPKEYLVPYMLYRVRQEKSGKHLQQWCEHCSLPLYSPRIIENVVSRLAFIDSHFLSHLELPSEHNALLQEMEVTLSSVETIFALETLRVVAPSLVVHMENMEFPKEALENFAAWCKDVSKKDGTSLSPVWRDVRENVIESHIARVLLCKLATASEETLEFALAQGYMASSVVHDDECALCLEQFRTNEDKNQYLKDYAKDRILPFEKAGMYISLMHYAVRHAEEPTSAEFAKACFDLLKSPETKDAGMPLAPYEWAWQLMEACYISKESRAASLSAWKNWAEQYLLKLDMKLYQQLVAALLEHRNEEYPSIEITASTRLIRALHIARENEIDGGPVDDVLRFVLNLYGRMMARCIVKGVQNDNEKQRWIIGQKYPEKRYVPYLQQGVDEYMAQDWENDFLDDDEQISARQNLFDALRIKMWNNRLTEIVSSPLCALSFAVVWEKLCHKCLLNKPISDHEREWVDSVLHDLDIADNTNIGKNKNFNANRMESIKILKSVLRQLISSEKE